MVVAHLEHEMGLIDSLKIKPHPQNKDKCISKFYNGQKSKEQNKKAKSIAKSLSLNIPNVQNSYMEMSLECDDYNEFKTYYP